MKRSLKVYFNFEVHKVYFVLSIVFRDYSLAEIDVIFLLLRENTAKTPLIRPGHIYIYIYIYIQTKGKFDGPISATPRAVLAIPAYVLAPGL